MSTENEEEVVSREERISSLQIIDSESTSTSNAALLVEGDVAEWSIVVTHLNDACLRVLLNLQS